LNKAASTNIIAKLQLSKKNQITVFWNVTPSILLTGHCPLEKTEELFREDFPN
jgi:hypothetical protein